MKQYRRRRKIIPRKIELATPETGSIEIVEPVSIDSEWNHIHANMPSRWNPEKPDLARSALDENAVESLSIVIADIYVHSLKNPNQYRPEWRRRRDAIDAIDAYLKYSVFGWKVDELALIYKISERSVERAIQKGSIYVKRYGPEAIELWKQRIDSKKKS